MNNSSFFCIRLKIQGRLPKSLIFVFFIDLNLYANAKMFTGSILTSEVCRLKILKGKISVYQRTSASYSNQR